MVSIALARNGGSAVGTDVLRQAVPACAAVGSRIAHRVQRGLSSLARGSRWNGGGARSITTSAATSSTASGVVGSAPCAALRSGDEITAPSVDGAGASSSSTSMLSSTPILGHAESMTMMAPTRSTTATSAMMRRLSTSFGAQRAIQLSSRRFYTKRSFAVAAASPSDFQQQEQADPAESASQANPMGGAPLGSKRKKANRGGFKQYLGPASFVVCSAGIAAAIVYQDELIESFEGTSMLASFEDFNDWSREKLMIFGDKLVPQKAEPWLLDFETLKYPPHLPTLVVDLDKLVCKLEFDRMAGWQVRKRPGADHFFNELQHYFEIVVFSDDMFPVAQDVIMRWGVQAGGVLHREFCTRKGKKFIKDIGKLGRNLERVIHIDHDPMAVSKYPANGIVIPPYDGDENDTVYDLVEFLKAAMHEADVREFIAKYGGDGDVGKRFLLEKSERERLVAKRRSMFSGMGGSRMKTDTMGRRF